MPYKDLAEKLINAKNASERKQLLVKNKKFADVKLAHAIKDTYYKSWTNEPKKVRNAALALKTLWQIKPSEEISAMQNWVEGIACLTNGKIENAVKFLDLASEKLKTIGKKELSAQPQVGKLIALALLGNYEEAIKTGKESLKIFEKFGDDLTAGKVEKNLGNIIVRQDGISKAEKFYISAIKRFEKINNLPELAMCEVNLADNYADLHDFQNAEKFYASALKHTSKAKMFFVEAEIQASLGNLAMLRGKYSDALKFLETARQNFEELNVPHRSVIAEFEIANIYFELNLSDEAFEIYQKVVEKLKKFKFRGEEAKARANLGRVALAKNDFSTARKELKKSEKLYELEKNLSGSADVKLTRANLEFSLENYQDALEIIRKTEKLLTRSENLPLKLQAKFRHGEILRRLKKHKTAEKVLSETFEKAFKSELLNLAQGSLNSLGKLNLQIGDQKQAENYFKRSIKLIENLRSPLPAEEFRMAFLADKLTPFENLAQIYVRANKITQAFQFIEKSRSRSLTDVLQAVEKRDVKKNSKNKKLLEKLENLREELNWFYSLQNRAEDSEIKNLQNEAKKREKQIAETLRQIESTATTKNNKRNLQEFSINTLQNRLEKKKALIEFVKFENSISAFVVTDKKIKYFADLAKDEEIIVLLEGLQFQFGALRYGAKHLGKFSDELKKRADFYLQKLYEKLIEPLAEIIENKNLVIVPVGTLHYVPFQGLFNGEKYLIENREIVSTPSANVWQILSEKKRTKPQNALLIGFEDENIPLVYQEIIEIKKIFKTTKTFIGEKATFQNYTKFAEDFDALHLACHGQFRPDNPLFSSLHLADGFVTVRDICSQNLNAEFVTLSACETGLSKIHAGDEILGLSRGFLIAGVHSIVLSLWTVNDEATKSLMKDFYTALQRGQSVSASLQKAQKNFISKNSHPYFWASFGIIGR